MPAPVKAEAIVLRSMRFGEADRILHLYTPGRGRMGAIAKGVRRTKSRFGGRLEPFSHVALVLHEDAKREYAYGPAQGLPDSKVGTLTQALFDEAKKKGWTVISMKNDWKRIFAFET